MNIILVCYLNVLLCCVGCFNLLTNDGPNMFFDFESNNDPIETRFGDISNVKHDRINGPIRIIRKKKRPFHDILLPPKFIDEFTMIKKLPKIKKTINKRFDHHDDYDQYFRIENTLSGFDSRIKSIFDEIFGFKNKFHDPIFTNVPVHSKNFFLPHQSSLKNSNEYDLNKIIIKPIDTKRHDFLENDVKGIYEDDLLFNDDPMIRVLDNVMHNIVDRSVEENIKSSSKKYNLKLKENNTNSEKSTLHTIMDKVIHSDDGYSNNKSIAVDSGSSVILEVQHGNDETSTVRLNKNNQPDMKNNEDTQNRGSDFNKTGDRINESRINSIPKSDSFMQWNDDDNNIANEFLDYKTDLWKYFDSSTKQKRIPEPSTLLYGEVNDGLNSKTISEDFESLLYNDKISQFEKQLRNGIISEPQRPCLTKNNVISKELQTSSCGVKETYDRNYKFKPDVEPEYEAQHNKEGNYLIDNDAKWWKKLIFPMNQQRNKEQDFIDDPIAYDDVERKLENKSLPNDDNILFDSKTEAAKIEPNDIIVVEDMPSISVDPKILSTKEYHDGKFRYVKRSTPLIEWKVLLLYFTLVIASFGLYISVRMLVIYCRNPNSSIKYQVFF